MTIIDSLFLELGIDTSKFSKDQQSALAKIAQFESQSKRAASGARGGIKSVGDAFRDLSKETSVGASAARIDDLATKFKNLGLSMSAAGGAGAAAGGMAKGLGMLLSPAALGIAAVGMLAKETLDFNASMTESNALLKRNAELSGMSATNLWAMGMAAKTVGGDPAGIQASIASLQTSLAGMSIGVGNATPALIGMARLRRFGAKYNPGGFGQGVDEESLFKAGYAYYQQYGRAKTMALLTGYGLTNTDQANLIMSKGGYAEYQKAQAQAQAMKTGGGFDAVVTKSLESQRGLGEKDIAQAIAAESGYGAIQDPMLKMVALLTGIYAVLNATLGWVAKFVNWIAPDSGSKLSSTLGGAASAAIDYFKGGSRAPGTSGAMRKGMAAAMQMLMAQGLSQEEAAVAVGSLAQESSMNPFARNGSHFGLAQWDKSRRADFAKWAGYAMGSSGVPADKQVNDQLMFLVQELMGNHKQALAKMRAARTLMGKESAFSKYFEVVNDGSLDRRYAFAQEALNLAGSSAMSVAHNDNSSVAHIGAINVQTNSDDPLAHAAAVRRSLMNERLLGPTAQGTVALATRAFNN